MCQPEIKEEEAVKKSSIENYETALLFRRRCAPSKKNFEKKILGRRLRNLDRFETRFQVLQLLTPSTGNDIRSCKIKSFPDS